MFRSAVYLVTAMVSVQIVFATDRAHAQASADEILNEILPELQAPDVFLRLAEGVPPPAGEQLGDVRYGSEMVSQLAGKCFQGAGWAAERHKLNLLLAAPSALSWKRNNADLFIQRRKQAVDDAAIVLSIDDCGPFTRAYLDQARLTLSSTLNENLEATRVTELWDKGLDFIYGEAQ